MLPCLELACWSVQLVLTFEHSQVGGCNEMTVGVGRYLDPCLQGGLVSYQERVVEGTVCESE